MFKASEIILNTDSSVYHLHLHPDQVSDTIITVGDPERVQLVSRHFTTIEHTVENREFITHTGYYNNKRITVISSGIGTDNIDIVLNELHILKHVDLQTRKLLPLNNPFKIFRIGTSGSLHSDIPVDSFVASHYAIGLDNLMHFYPFQNTKEEDALLQNLLTAIKFPATISPYVFASSKELQTHFDSGFHKGITMTCPGFYGPQARAIFSSPILPNFLEQLNAFQFQNYRICNFEMESSGLFGLCALLNHQCISLNAILANRADGTFSKQPEKTIARLIEKCLDVIGGIDII
ncbi:MAG: nucleoside phosphorylase [Bacteroidetes bacterium]|nr:nucleoside phosphorylase [Bacteroidota bacterium]